jgi:hypothetical protein
MVLYPGQIIDLGLTLNFRCFKIYPKRQHKLMLLNRNFELKPWVGIKSVTVYNTSKSPYIFMTKFSIFYTIRIISGRSRSNLIKINTKVAHPI